jgi:sialic acid synthase SpsE
LFSKGAPKVEYQKKTSSNETHYEMIEKLELSLSDHFVLADYRKAKEISFLSTPYDLESTRFLQDENKCGNIKNCVG